MTNHWIPVDMACPKDCNQYWVTVQDIYEGTVWVDNGMYDSVSGEWIDSGSFDWYPEGIEVIAWFIRDPKTSPKYYLIEPNPFLGRGGIPLAEEA